MKSIFSCMYDTLQKVKKNPNDAQTNKQGSEQQREVMKRNELFGISMC